MKANIRKVATFTDAVQVEMGQTVDPPSRRAAAVAIIENPYSDLFSPGLDELVAIGEELGGYLGDKCVEALSCKPDDIQSYGKAAMVGENGEIEHAAAILHPKLGAPLRKAVDNGAALVPSSKKMGGPGQPLDIPLGHKDAAYVRSHFDGMTVQINDAPRPDEIMVAVAVALTGRPLARVGGLTHEQVEGKDGLR